MNFSTKQYGWKDITVVIGGKVIPGITNVEYNQKQDNKYLYGRGNNPHEILEGNNEFDGKIELWQSELEALTLTAPNKDITKLRFDIVVSYTPEDDGIIVTDVMKQCKITEVKKGQKQGDTHSLHELPLMFLGVERQKGI